VGVAFSWINEGISPVIAWLKLLVLSMLGKVSFGVMLLKTWLECKY
jgi:hypothetical protein